MLCYRSDVIACDSVCSEDGVVTDVRPEHSILEAQSSTKHKHDCAHTCFWHVVLEMLRFKCHRAFSRQHLKHCETQWVSQVVFIDNEGVTTATLNVNTGERVQLGVHPVETLVNQVYGGKEREERVTTG